jgi:hypothetical protein
VKNNFYLGCYQQAISEALSAPSSPMCMFYMYRAYIEQAQYRMVLDEVGHDAPMALQAVKLLASYQAGGRDAKDMALVQLKEWLSSPRAATEPQLMLIAALIYSHEGDTKEALKCVHQSADLETMSLVAHIFLAMSRVDLARKQVGLMQQQDDDATLTKLAHAWVSMAEGGEKYQDALYEFQARRRPTVAAAPASLRALCPPLLCTRRSGVRAAARAAAAGARRKVQHVFVADQWHGACQLAHGQVRRGRAPLAGGTGQVRHRRQHARQHGGDHALSAKAVRRDEPVRQSAALRRADAPVDRQVWRLRGELRALRGAGAGMSGARADSCVHPGERRPANPPRASCLRCVPSSLPQRALRARQPTEHRGARLCGALPPRRPTLASAGRAWNRARCALTPTQCTAVSADCGRS